MNSQPYLTVALSATSYAILYRSIRYGAKSQELSSLQAAIKSLSFGHSSLMTLLVLYSLQSSQWNITKAPQPGKNAQSNLSNSNRKLTSNHLLDDSSNPVIVSSSNLSRYLSSWETGYLIYDTCMLVVLTQHASKTPISSLAAFKRLALTNPAITVHHVGLAAALMTLQVYIGQCREKGMWIIMAFFLMNASNPVMHALWFAKKKGRSARRLEVVFAIMFAASRFGVIWWILRKYGSYHNIGPVTAYSRLRIPCQVGTGALLGLNGLWWLMLLRNIVLKQSKTLKVA